jgi:hypothetical protein
MVYLTTGTTCSESTAARIAAHLAMVYWIATKLGGANLVLVMALIVQQAQLDSLVVLTSLVAFRVGRALPRRNLSSRRGRRSR